MDLDPSLRNDVLLPLTAIIILIQLIRTKMQSHQPKPKIPLNQVRKQGIQHLIKQCTLAAPFVAAKIKAQLLWEIENEKPVAAPEDPMDQLAQQQQSMQGMMGGMKSNMMFIIPQSVLFGWINWSFSEFVLLQVPFVLPNVLGEMLQRGINAHLPNEFVSALSWYFLNVFASQHVLALFTGFDVQISTDMPMMMPNMMPGQEKKEKELVEQLNLTKTNMDDLLDLVITELESKK
eukprot:NODE_539_length_6967_cov_0.428800.p3 type:complete len:234 gc:universal NODE_539_length_6967_cov_0.428800:6349-5648(-)